MPNYTVLLQLQLTIIYIIGHWYMCICDFILALNPQSTATSWRPNFILVNRKTSQGAKPGEWGQEMGFQSSKSRHGM